VGRRPPSPPQLLALRTSCGLTLIAMRRTARPGQSQATIIAPLADDRAETGDVLSLLGSTERLSELEALLGD